jgi:hypothetical protein
VAAVRLSWVGQADGASPARVAAVQTQSGSVTVQSGGVRISSTSTVFTGVGAQLQEAFSAGGDGELSGVFTLSRASANCAMIMSIRAQDGALTQVGGCWDGYLLTFTSAVTLYQVAAGSLTSIGSGSYSPSASAVRFRLRAVGSRVSWKHWADGTAEPDWVIDVFDGTQTHAASENAYCVLGIQVLDTTASTIDFSELAWDNLAPARLYRG